MRKFPNKITSACAALGLSLSLISFASHAGADVCTASENEGGIVLGFFNGVNTTVDEALENLRELKKIHGRAIRTSGGTESISYDLFYNITRGAPDAAEVILQIRQERVDAGEDVVETALGNGRGNALFDATIFQNKLEYYLSFLSGLSNRWTDEFLNIASEDEELRRAAVASMGTMTNIMIDALDQEVRERGSLVDLDEGTALADYQRHRLRIDHHILAGKKLMFVAHSQGNLFVNRAYDYAKPKTDAVRVMHIAPASYRLAYDGAPYVLADRDYVIGTLSTRAADVTDSRIPSRETYPIPAHIPFFRPRPAGTNGETDSTGHNLIAIYLNHNIPAVDDQHQPIATVVKNHINDNLRALALMPQPSQSVSNGFFTVTMSWDGPGDVDLHVIEPRAPWENTPRPHVYYSNKQGQSGRLDHDNTQGFGANLLSEPEHYYASCDNEVLMRGDYKIGVRNYSRASGRRVTLMINDKDGNIVRTFGVNVPSTVGEIQHLVTLTVGSDRSGSTLSDGIPRPVITGMPMIIGHPKPYSDWLGLLNE